jgi:hypothetical protein
MRGWLNRKANSPKIVMLRESFWLSNSDPVGLQKVIPTKVQHRNTVASWMFSSQTQLTLYVFIFNHTVNWLFSQLLSIIMKQCNIILQHSDENVTLFRFSDIFTFIPKASLIYITRPEVTLIVKQILHSVAKITEKISLGTVWTFIKRAVFHL